MVTGWVTAHKQLKTANKAEKVHIRSTALRTDTPNDYSQKVTRKHHIYPLLARGCQRALTYIIHVCI